MDALGLEDRSRLAGHCLDLGGAAERSVDLGQLEGDQGGVVGVVLLGEAAAHPLENSDRLGGPTQARGDLPLLPVDSQQVELVAHLPGQYLHLSQDLLRLRKLSQVAEIGREVHQHVEPARGIALAVDQSRRLPEQVDGRLVLAELLHGLGLADQQRRPLAPLVGGERLVQQCERFRNATLRPPQRGLEMQDPGGVEQARIGGGAGGPQLLGVRKGPRGSGEVATTHPLGAGQVHPCVPADAAAPELVARHPLGGQDSELGQTAGTLGTVSCRPAALLAQQLAESRGLELGRLANQVQLAGTPRAGAREALGAAVALQVAQERTAAADKAGAPCPRLSQVLALSCFVRCGPQEDQCTSRRRRAPEPDFVNRLSIGRHGRATRSCRYATIEGRQHSRRPGERENLPAKERRYKPVAYTLQPGGAEHMQAVVLAPTAAESCGWASSRSVSRFNCSLLLDFFMFLLSADAGRSTFRDGGGHPRKREVGSALRDALMVTLKTRPPCPARAPRRARLRSPESSAPPGSSAGCRRRDGAIHPA